MIRVWTALTLCLTCATLAIAQGYVTRFDDDGAIIVNGKRTIIIGSYYDPKSAEPYKEMAEAGFNLVNTGAYKAALDGAHAAGLMAWVPVGTLDLAKVDESRAALEAAVAAVKDHPAVAILETTDEPAWSWMKADARVPAQALVDAYPVIKGIDPNHLLYTNHAPTNLVKTMQAYNGGTDIVACDIYPVNPGGLKHQYALFEDGHQGDLNNEHISQVGEYVEKMRRVAGPNRPVFMVLQGFAWEMLLPEHERREEKILYPSFAQQRFMAFQSVIKGANGIIYWGTDFTPQPSQAWTDLKRAVREVADLAGPLSQRNSALRVNVDYEEIGQSVDDGVQWMVKEYDGKLFLFTCNADKTECRATLSGFSGWTKANVIGENRTIELKDGGFSDYWKRFDVHVYELSR